MSTESQIFARIRSIVDEKLRGELLALFTRYVGDRDVEMTKAMDEKFRQAYERELKR